MDYIEGNLGTGEKILLRAKVNWLAVAATFLWGVIVEVAYIVLSTMVLPQIFGDSASSEDSGTSFLSIVKIVITVIVHFLGWWPTIKRILVISTTKLAVTNKRVIGKTGILSINTIDFHIDKVDNVSYNAGLWGNIFHFYDLTVAGTGDRKRTIRFISNAQAFKNTVSEAIEKHADEARKAQAAEIAAAMNAGKSSTEA